jgi:hypothetical protein
MSHGEERQGSSREQEDLKSFLKDPEEMEIQMIIINANHGKITNIYIGT